MTVDLINAVKERDLHRVKNLLKDSSIIMDLRDPLIWASDMGYLDILKELLQYPKAVQSINRSSYNGVTALILACQNGHLDVVKELLQYPEAVQSINRRAHNGVTALILACQNGHLDVVKELLQYPEAVQSINRLDDNGITALSTACQNGHLDIVKELLKYPETIEGINIQNTSGDTSLMFACHYGYLYIVKELLKFPEVIQGINIQNKKGVTSLFLSLYSRNGLDIIKELLKYPETIEGINIQDISSKSTTLMLAVSKDNGLDIVKELLNYPKTIEGINIQNNYGRTALMLAAKDNRLDIVKELLKYPKTIEGINIQDIIRETALTLAYKRNNLDIVDELSKYTHNHQVILNYFIGPDQGAFHNEFPYQIPLSQDFVKKTQYHRSTDEELKRYKEYGSHVVFKCPVGHLHAPGECGVPTEVKRCGIDNCKYLVGGRHHYLVPGNYIVYHDGYDAAKIWYGNFPVGTYAAYLLMVEQYNIAVDKYNDENPNEEQLPKIIPVQPVNEPAEARKLNDIEEEKVIEENVMCSICLTEVEPDDKEKLYVLPDCGHIIHEECLRNARGGDLGNVNDLNEANMNARKCGECGKKFRFGMNGKQRYYLSKKREESRCTIS